MLVYPQLRTGALAQYPAKKTRTTRTIRNQALDGSWIKCADPAAETTEWEIRYAGLSDEEAQLLGAFFESAEGCLNSFTFVDPMGNLFVSSDHLDAGVWIKDPWLALTAADSDDPEGGSRAWHLCNGGDGPQRLTQTIQGPPDYTYCFSVYLRSDSTKSIVLSAGGRSESRTVFPNWSRAAIAAPGDSMRFGIELPAGSEVDAFGMQLEPQPTPSPYQSSTRGGVYEGARLRDDRFTLTMTGLNQHSCTVNIFHANHL